MDLATVLFVAGGVWMCVLGVFVALCRAAKLGDEALVKAMVADSRQRQRLRRHKRPERSHIRAIGPAGVYPGRR
jgi:hypothetical protein